MIEVLAAQFAAFLALLLAAAAGHKLLRWSSMQDVVVRFGRVPARLAAPAVVTALGLESCAGALLWLPATRAAGALLAAGIWAVYAALLLRALRQGWRDLDCGCSLRAVNHALSGYQPARNAVLVGLAVLVAVGAAGGGVPVSGVPVAASQVLGACALLALYAALDEVMTLPPLRRGGLA